MIIAVDFDGTLCTEAYPQIGEPIIETIELVKQLHKAGNTIILYTCRVDTYLEDAVEWCKQHQIPIDYVNENVPERITTYKIDCRKISADIYIDDKAINLSKQFDKLNKYIKENNRMATKKEKEIAETCKDCIHKEVCKYTETLTLIQAENDNTIKAPFEIQCKHKQTSIYSSPGTNPGYYPYWLENIREINITGAKCAYSDSCGFWRNGKCEAPNNIAGLPCQQVLCQQLLNQVTSETPRIIRDEVGPPTPEVEAQMRELSSKIFKENKTISAPNSACLSH